ncbi:MAG: glycosyltransferase family 2 protein [Steroidobacteraceae bacterium]
MSAALRLPVTLLVIARNEAPAIGRCLDSVPFAAEKLVVDSGSTDGTQEVAARHGARVVHQDWLGFGPQRNFATAQSSHDWILSLDADEALSPELALEMERRLPQLMQSDRAGAVLRRQTWYMGAPMRWYRPMMGERLGRLYDRRRARWTNVRVHESLQFDGATETFTHPFIHLNNPTLVHKQLKTLRYAELKARDWADRAKPAHMWLTPFVHAAAFLKDYVLRLAFLDGWRGYVVAQSAASYAVYKRMRYYEMRRNPASREMAASLLRGYGLDP